MRIGDVDLLIKSYGTHPTRKVVRIRRYLPTFCDTLCITAVEEDELSLLEKDFSRFAMETRAVQDQIIHRTQAICAPYADRRYLPLPEEEIPVDQMALF